MAKLVKRLLLNDIYEIDRNESWFSYMAKKGLHLNKIGRTFVYFEKGDPKNTKYRIDILYEEPSQEKMDVYSDCGWSFVTQISNFYIFSADENADTIELHTDPIEQRDTLDKLNKKLKSNLIIVSIAMILFLGMICSIYIFNREPFLYMINGQLVQQILLVVVELYVFYSVIRNYLAGLRLEKSLLQGKKISHKENFEKTRIMRGILVGIFLSIAIVTIFIPVTEMSKRERYTLPETTNTLSIVRLADIEQNANLIRDEYITDKGVDFSNMVSYNWSILAPVQYDVHERGIVKGEMWEDKSGEYSPSINTRFYKLTFRSMAEKLTQDLISRYVYRDNIEIKEISNTNLDKIYVAEEGIRKQIFAYLDNKVIYVTYYGNAEIDDLVPLVADKLLSWKS